MKLEIQPVKSICGSMRPPSDKSLTHRAYMFGAAATGPSVVRHPLRGEDCEATLRCVAQMGLRYEWISPTEVRLTPAPEWTQPPGPLDCGNSGTTMRLLSGFVASRPLDVIMIGDASLSRRPMKRIAEPLRLMGATVEGDTPPLHIVGTANPRPIRYQSPVASGQIKSCVLLAGLRADGVTSVTEPFPSRDHTERMLECLGIPLFCVGDADAVSGPGVTVGLRGPVNLPGFEIAVPGDISSAAFFMVAAAILPHSEVLFQDVSLNPTRTGVLDVLCQAGVFVERGAERTELGEPVADVKVGHADGLRAFRIEGGLVPTLLDEIPVLAVLATQCEGTSVIKDAKELRVKESDRIEVVAAGLRSMGAKVETFEDGLAVTGPTRLKAAAIDAQHDHRIAMAFAIAGLIAEGTTVVDGAESIATSFPSFEEELRRLCVV